jgi:hypothetical protein
MRAPGGSSAVPITRLRRVKLSGAFGAPGSLRGAGGGTGEETPAALMTRCLTC